METRKPISDCEIRISKWGGPEIQICNKLPDDISLTKFENHAFILKRGSTFLNTPEYLCFLDLFCSLIFILGDNNGWSLQFDKYFTTNYRMTSPYSSEAGASECRK